MLSRQQLDLDPLFFLLNASATRREAVNVCLFELFKLWTCGQSTCKQDERFLKVCLQGGLLSTVILIVTASWKHATLLAFTTWRHVESLAGLLIQLENCDVYLSRLILHAFHVDWPSEKPRPVFWGNSSNRHRLAWQLETEYFRLIKRKYEKIFWNQGWSAILADLLQRITASWQFCYGKQWALHDNDTGYTGEILQYHYATKMSTHAWS